MTKIVFAILPTAGGKVREEFIAQLSATADFSKASEPGVLGYSVCVPRDAADEKTVYMIEVYADQAALDAHMQSDRVQAMVQWMGAHPELFPAATAPTVVDLEVTAETGLFARADALAQTADPYVVVGELAYKDAALVTQSLPYWAQVSQTTRADEPGSVLYAISRVPAQPERLVSLEAYTSKDYLWDVHAKSAAVQANVRDTKDWRTGLTHHALRQVHGFLARAKI